ncbi:MAG: DNA adenine methylase [Candidatus Magnetominusculus sp. LBB02]|nr:DNA adenine methylase [Candidatus Magnetominusculus sp. LBB02]
MFHKIEEPVRQLSLFGVEPPPKKKIVNVASVKQLSPFRYPGGKTWLVPTVRQWLKCQKHKPSEFIEVFAGGGIVGLSVANERLSGHVTMIELDPEIAAVWHTILSDDAQWLAKEILSFELSIDNARRALERTATNTREKAFQTILKNRTFHGGIIAAGSGFLKSGENGKGIASRWYPQTIAKRIRYIETFRQRITFIEGDGIQYMREMAHRQDVAYFIDPPYTAPGKRAGSRLYTFFEIDHEQLFDIALTLRADFMMTYDDAASVRKMADSRNFHIATVPMKGTHHNEVEELLVTPVPKHIL